MRGTRRRGRRARADGRGIADGASQARRHGQPRITISLKQGLKPVRALKAGRYRLVVTDKSSIHNFRLIGPGVNRAITTVGGTGAKTVTLMLKKGRYTFHCDVHPTMVGHFTVA